MSAATELAILYARDLKRLAEEIVAFPTEESLWATLPGISNSAGHLVLHLEGNLSEFVGRQLGGHDYTRDRPQEFAGHSVSKVDLLSRISGLGEQIPHDLSLLTQAQMDEDYPQDFMGSPLSTSGMLIHLNGHLQWHLGQIDYLRRVLTGAGAISLALL